MKVFKILFSVFLLLISISWVLGLNKALYSRVIGSAHEDARREVFEHSRAYIQGTVLELQNMQFEYLKSTPEQQRALAPIIKRRAAQISSTEMPSQLYNFIKELP